MPSQKPQILLLWIFTVVTGPLSLHREEGNKPSQSWAANTALSDDHLEWCEPNSRRGGESSTPSLLLQPESSCFLLLGRAASPTKFLPYTSTGKKSYSCLLLYPFSLNYLEWNRGGGIVTDNCKSSICHKTTVFMQLKLVAHPGLSTSYTILSLSVIAFLWNKNFCLPLCPRKLLSFLCS